MASGIGFGPQFEDDMELLKAAHQEVGSRIPPEHLPQLAGLPEQWRLCATGNRGSVKDCLELRWNSDPLKRYTALELLMKPELAKQCIGAGVQTGPASGGLLVLDFDEPSDMALDGLAETTFQEVFGRPSSDLPVTATNTSGRRGRRKVFLQVPEDWWPVLGNWSISAGAYGSNQHSFEGIWLNGTGTARHAVVAGDHPKTSESQPLAYCWADGLHPAVVGVAVAPPWVLGGFIRQAQKSLTPKPSEEDDSFHAKRAAGEPQPCDLLLPKDQRRLLLLMQKHWPYRGAPADSPLAGSYKAAFRPLVAGLLNVLGKDTALAWLGGQEWDRRNDWADGNVGSFEEVMKSLARSATDEEAKCGWGSIVAAAKAGGFEFPKWALPPRDALESVDDLTRIIQKMNQSEGKPIQMALLEGDALRLGVKPSRLYQLRLEEMLGVAEDRRGRSLSEIADAKSQRGADRQRDVVDGLLKRRVTCLAGASNSGKTTLAAYLVRNVVLGGRLMVGPTAHDVPSGKVLWFTSDCSDEAVHDELVIQGVNPAEVGDRLRVVERATFNNMLQVVNELQEFKPDLVVMDCLSSMAVNHVSVADPAFSQPLRDLQTYNGKAWPRAAFLMLHHTTRDQPVRFSGGEQIKAAVEEMWIYFDPQLVERKKPGEKMKPTEETGLRKLWFEKSRSGYRGKELTVIYEGSRNRWLWRPSGSASKDPRAMVDAFFRNWRGDEWKIPADWRRELLTQQVVLDRKPMERMLKLLDGSLLESKEMHHPGSGKQLRHYRAMEHVRRLAAQTWEGTKDGSGVNELE